MALRTFLTTNYSNFPNYFYVDDNPWKDSTLLM